jgi:Ca-activated chloride channel family protein
MWLQLAGLRRGHRLWRHRLLAALLLICVAVGLPGSMAKARAQEEQGGQEGGAEPAPSSPQADPSEAIARLDPKYRQWLQTVAGLITGVELHYFLNLRSDYRRDAFIEAFWEPRDPDPQTPVNELRQRWQEIINQAGGLPYNDPRFLLYLLNGPPRGSTLPNGQPATRCFSKSYELEIWFYDGSERTPREFIVIFQRRAKDSPYEVVYPGSPLRPMQRAGGLPVTDIRLLCADEFLRYALYEAFQDRDYDQLIEMVLTPPQPSPEWVAKIAASGTDLPEGAETFSVEVDLSFPARRQSRTAVQVMLGVPLEAAPGRRFDGELFHNFLVRGEVIRDERLFESFRYRFEGPTPEEAKQISVGFTRYLRPGPVSLRILLEDVFSNRFAQVVREIEVPSSQGLPSVSTAVAQRPSGPSLRLLPPPGNIQVGLVRFRTRVTGEFEKVTFYLDDKPVLTKRSPPYSVELNLGSVPEAHRVRVVGFAGGRETATDQIWLNQGTQRFRVRLIEPRPGGIYPGSLIARIEVDTPDGRPPEQMELYLNDQQVAVLREPPFTQLLRLTGGEVAVVRAVAYLADGSWTEEAVLVNTSGFAEAIEVQMVELPVLVTDATGQAISGLSREQFRVFEDGVPQEIRRFEESSDAPLQAALLIDRSASMEPHLKRVVEASLTFANAALRSAEDRIAVISFAEESSVDAGLTASSGQLERALAGLVAYGGTALYDSIVQAINTFEGVRGQTALLLFSDGRDESSRLSVEQVVETARRSGVTLYAVGLEEAFQEKAERRILEELAAETGGRAYFVAGLEELPAVYGSILEELRSRYLLAYQSSSTQPASDYRGVRVEVDLKGAQIRTRRGYYP